VITLFSGSCRIEAEGRLYHAVLPSKLARNQRASVAVGDEVLFDSHGGHHRIAEIRPRRTSLSRPDPQNPRLERVVAANVDVVVLIVSVSEPPLRTALVDRYLIAIERGGAEPLLCVNKIDLLPPGELAAELAKLDAYRDMGLAVLPCSARTGAGAGELRAILAGRTAAFVGHSGVGKSSLLKAIAPDVGVTTGSLSRRHARGRHTTSRSQLYRLTDGIRVIDTPGIREMGLWRMSPEELRFYFDDFEEDARRCRFNDCTHTHEPDCGVRAAVDQGRLSQARYAAYVRILKSVAEVFTR
jgi:ribosome biogenesis GTPase